jgi:hypothetical protein
MSHNLKVNQRVFWTDPDQGLCSGWGKIIHVQHQDDDAVISILTDDGGEVEAYPHELQSAPTVEDIRKTTDRIPYL